MKYRGRWFRALRGIFYAVVIILLTAAVYFSYIHRQAIVSFLTWKALPVHDRAVMMAIRKSIDIVRVRHIPDTTRRERALLAGARSRLGDEYDTSYYSEGYPPPGKSACTDIIYFAYLELGIDLMSQVSRDVRSYPYLYPVIEDDAIDYRRTWNLIVWFRRFTIELPLEADPDSYPLWRPGDVVFWSENGGDAHHVGIVSDAITFEGRPLVIHQTPPECVEADVLTKWKIVGHFRYED